MPGRFNVEDYVDVQSRIHLLWDKYPEASIVTQLMSPPDDFTQCRYRAEIFRAPDETRPAATGFAFEIAGGGGANQTSHEENCETSAIGRALANMGFATSRNRASREEMEKVNRGIERDEAQPARPVPKPVPDAITIDRASEKQVKYLHALARDLNYDDATLHDEVERLTGKTSITELTKREMSVVIDAIKPANAPAPVSTADIDWNRFWTWARQQGLRSRQEIDLLLGQDTGPMTPADLRDLIVQTQSEATPRSPFYTAPATTDRGEPGEDKWSA